MKFTNYEVRITSNKFGNRAKPRLGMMSYEYKNTQTTDNQLFIVK